jgi:predicted DNA-binding transcriptional regulator AlpA
MARREITGIRKSGVVSARLIDKSDDERTPPPPRLAFGILEFCAAVGISEDFFYKLKRQGQAPRLTKVGSRTLITLAAANEWLIEHEAAAKIEA